MERFTINCPNNIKINNLLKSILRILMFFIVSFYLVGCVSFERIVDVPSASKMASLEKYKTNLHQQSIHIFNPISLDNKVVQYQLQPRVDHLIFLIDQSEGHYLDGTIDDNDQSNLSRYSDTNLLAREMVRRFSQTMPEKEYSGAVLQYKKSKYASINNIDLSQYSASGLEKILRNPESIDHFESQSLAMAIDQLSLFINKLSGSTAIVLVTNWSKIDTSVEKAVMRMRQHSLYKRGLSVLSNKQGIRSWDSKTSGICLYTLGVGNALSRSRLQSVDTCGFSVAAHKVAQPRDMAHFVQTVLYKGPADTDHDGIYDYLDQCPNTAKGRIVNYSGCLRFSGEFL